MGAGSRSEHERGTSVAGESYSAKPWLIAVAALLAAHAAILICLGTRSTGALLSNLFQLTFGILCIPACLQASRRSGSLGRYFWRLMTFTFVVWCAGQLLGAYNESQHRETLSWLNDILFIVSTVPLGMALFLDPDHETNRFNRFHILDFIQAVCFWSAVYLYFSRTQPAISLNDSAWKRSLVYDVVLTGAFFLRAVLTKSPVVRALFGRMLAFVLLAGVADAYSNYPRRNLYAG